MSADPTGGCQCGVVRYRVTGGLGGAGFCHCRMCQRAAGNAFAPLVTATGVVWLGTPGRWASSSIAQRGFCAACGTPLFLRDFNMADDTFEIMIATLDDPEAVSPSHHYGIESRIGWLKMSDGLPEYKTGGRPGEAPVRLTSLQYPADAAAKEDR